jgi:hypothetical protein
MNRGGEEVTRPRVIKSNVHDVEHGPLMSG